MKYFRLITSLIFISLLDLASSFTVIGFCLSNDTNDFYLVNLYWFIYGGCSDKASE